MFILGTFSSNAISFWKRNVLFDYSDIFWSCVYIGDNTSTMFCITFCTEFARELRMWEIFFYYV
jgi:hypothetical protein